MKKLIAIIWLLFAIAVNVLALAGLLYQLGWTHTSWNGGFGDIAQTYLKGVEALFSPLDEGFNSNFGRVAPYWVLHLFVFYLASASALFIGHWAFLTHKVKTPFSGLLSALAWPVLAPLKLFRWLTHTASGLSVDYAKVFLGIVAATGFSFGLAKILNPKSSQAELTAYSSPQEAEFAEAIYDQCATVFNKYGRQSQYLQKNFQQALINKNWNKAEKTAYAINQFSACLSSDLPILDNARVRADLGPYTGDLKRKWVNIAKVNLGLGDEFYAAEQWAPAHTYYKDGLTAFDKVVSDFVGPSVNMYEPATEQDLDLSVLFNSQTIYAQRLNQLSAAAKMISAHQYSQIKPDEFSTRIENLQNLRWSYFIDTTENYSQDLYAERPIAGRLKTDGRIVIAHLVDTLLAHASMIESDELQIEATQHLNALLSIYEKYDQLVQSNILPSGEIDHGPSAELQSYWDRLSDTVNTLYQENLEQNISTMAPFQFALSQRLSEHFIASQLWTYENNDAAPEQEKQNILHVGEKYTKRFLDVSRQLEPAQFAALLDSAPHDKSQEYSIVRNSDARLDPYKTYIRVLALQGRNEEALKMHHDRALYHLRLETIPEQLYVPIDTSVAASQHGTRSAISDYLTFGLGDPTYVTRIDIVEKIYPRNRTIQSRWNELVTEKCKQMTKNGRDFGTTSCPKFLLNLFYPDAVSVGGTGAYSSQNTVTPATTEEYYEATVNIDLLFGTTRAFDENSSTPEMMFTKKDDPLARGWRGQTTLSAPQASLGEPLLADAFATVFKNRSNNFTFIGRPLIFGHDMEAHQAFISELKTRLQNAQKDEVLIFVHGVGNTFNSAAKRTAQLTYDLSFPGQAMFYTWPTEDSFLGYFKDIDVPQMAIDDLAKFIGDAENAVATACDGQENCAPGKVNIIAHSHGARVTKDALEKLTKDRKNAGRKLQLGQIIFAAPDVDGKKLRKAVDKNLSQISDRVTIYTNNSDKALWGSSLLRFFKWRGGLGKKGTCAARMIDASSAVRFGSHSYFAEESEVIADLRTSLWHSDTEPDQRCYLTKTKKNSVAKWKFDKENCDITAYDLASQIAIQSQQGGEVDFDRLYTDLIGGKHIQDATNTNVDGADPNTWTLLNVTQIQGVQPAPVRVRKTRYDKAKTVYAEFTKQSPTTLSDPCAP